MGTIMNILKISTRSELRQWLTENHVELPDAWVPVLSKDPDELSYLAIVEECICFGWIDSTKKRVDDTHYQRISPRRKKGNWTELNKERARRLISLGLMTQNGEKALPDLSPDSFVIHDDVMKAIKNDAQVYENFLNLPELYIRVRIDNIQSYPREDEIFAKRLEKFIENTGQNKLYGDWNDKGRLLS